VGTGSLTRIVIGLFSATALLLGGVFVVLLVSVINLRGDDSDARRSSDLLTQSFAVERSVVDLETGLRGFLLTGQTGFLDPYDQARAHLPGEIMILRTLARGPVEQREVNGIASSISSYIADYADPLVASGGRLSLNEKIAVTSSGKQLVDAIRGRFDAFDAGDAALRQRQRLSANHKSSLAIAVAVTGLVVSLLLLLAQRIYLVVRILRPIRAVAEAAARVARGDFGVRVPRVGIGEVALLGDSFNEMAGVIQARDAEISTARMQLEHAVEDAEEASAMKSNFLANMSHELRTPLNGVIGMMNLLAETRLDTEQRQYVDAARSSGDALMTVVNDILDIAKIEAGRMELERRDFDLHDMVESTCDMVAATALSKGLELQSFVHDDVPRAVRGDRMRVSQILANLVSNAVKFTAEGEVAVEVSVGERTGTVVSVAFEVRDTGIGIPRERIDDLFDPFTQGDAGTTREFGGTGLGLTISHELTQLMGGKIEAESEVGKGSTFRFTIPFDQAESQLPTPVPAAGLRGVHVLVVDDNATNRRVFEAYLASWAMRPEVAKDAEHAFALLKAAARNGDPFDLALLDLNLPGESGVALARRITAASALHRTRLILLTSSGQAGADDRGTGIRYHLTKPVRQSRLLDAISLVMAPDGTERHRERESPDEAPPTAETGKGSRILVAEDQRVNWMLIERMLTKRGHTAVNTTDGESAIETLKREQFDLVLMDCQMPIVDGYDATRQIRRLEAAEDSVHVPIVAMTANAMLGDRERCIAAGMDDYIAKPITNETLDAVLARWLQSATVKLDRERLDELRSLFPGAETDAVLHELTRDVVAQLECIAAAVSRQDRAAAAAAAHRIGNSARMLGAGELATDAARLEDLARSEHANGVPTLESSFQALRRCWHYTQVAIALEFER
jgi:signal transduction histidine kinase/DNA-binding response OmpR family regulator